MIQRIRPLLVVLTLAAAFGLAPAANAAKVNARSEAPKVIVAKVHADWCGACEALAPTVAALEERYGTSDVLFVTLDFTSEASTVQAALLGEALGIGEAIRRHNNTGALLVMPGNGPSSLEAFSHTSELADIVRAIETLRS